MLCQDERKTILIIDDAEDQRFLVTRLLEDHYQTRVAAGGQEALRSVGNGPLPDLILLDVVMPHMDGYEVCRRLKTQSATQDIPVIFLTGQSAQNSEVKGFELGAVDYITKPINPLVLLARVKTHLENSSLYQEKQSIYELLRHTLLPKIASSLLGVEFAHKFVPSRLLSGDFLDIIALDQHRLGIIMADVAGKGPDAAIQTVRAKYLVRAAALAGLTPVGILDLLNRQLDEDPNARTLTAFYAELDLAQSTLTYCSAGHEPALLWRPSQQRWQELGPTAVMLGATCPLERVQPRLPIEPNSCLLIVTDGVTEARSRSGEFLGMEPLARVATDYLQGPPQSLIEALYQEVFRFTEGQFSDDVSMLALRIP